MSDDLETFGFGGKQPAPCSERAQRIASAVVAMVAADKALNEATDRVPEYTGQWSSSDYYALEMERWYRAADELERALTPKEPS